MGINMSQERLTAAAGPGKHDHIKTTAQDLRDE